MAYSIDGNYSGRPLSHRTARLAFSIVLVLGTFVGAAGAAEHGGDSGGGGHGGGGGGGGHGFGGGGFSGHSGRGRGGWNGGYYASPGLIYGAPYYCAPPLIYGPDPYDDDYDDSCE